MILARGTGWAVVSKPSGLPVHRSKMVNERRTLLRAVRKLFDCDFLAPVHRLDRPASGCLLLSLDRDYTSVLQAALSNGDKRYLAFVRGATTDRDAVRVANPMKDDNGILKDAETVLRPVASVPDPRSSIIEARPVTGRYHQVRRHCRDLSHPVLCDSMHGDTRVNRFWREEHGLRRLGLHALSLTLAPEGGEPIDVSCPVPRDLRDVWERVGLWDEAVAAVPQLARVATLEL